MVVLLLLAIDTFILLTWQVVDPTHTAVKHFPAEVSFFQGKSGFGAL